MLKERFRDVENRLLWELKSLYGQRLVSVVLFGSAARETQRLDSDIDFLIIAEGLPRGRMKRMGELEVVEDRLEPFLISLQQEGIHTYL